MKLNDKINKWTAWSWIIIALTLVSAWYWYSILPSVVITHWDMAGQPNGWSSRVFATWFLPGLMLLMFLFLMVIPKLDPRQENYKKFGDVYSLFIFFIILFLAILYIISNLVNLGVNLDISQITISLMGLLFIFMGAILDRIKSNWFIGIRTPWTLSSESVWRQTHIFGRKVFMISGLLLLLSQLLAVWLRWGIFCIAILFMLTPVIYSYFLYKKEQK